MTASFKPGDIVDITIKGVRVRHQAADGIVTIWDDEERCFSMPPQATVRRTDRDSDPEQTGGAS